MEHTEPLVVVSAESVALLCYKHSLFMVFQKDKFGQQRKCIFNTTVTSKLDDEEVVTKEAEVRNAVCIETFH